MVRCEACNNTFRVKPSRARRGVHFCSYACQHSRTPEQLFWMKVNRNGPVPTHCPELGPCWLWMARCRLGYGQVRVSGKLEGAHRFSFAIENKRWPTVNVLHRCDNPTCVNPQHLFEGTQEENVRDRERKGRGGQCKRRGEHCGTAKLTSRDVIILRQSAKDGVPMSHIARQFGVTYDCVLSIVRGRTWRWLK